MAKDAASWNKYLECGPILRYLGRSNKWISAYDLSEALSKRSASIFRSLTELENNGLIKAKWIDGPDKKVPRRRMYQLTNKGLSVARQLDT